MQQCIDRFEDIARRYVRYKVVLPPDLWKRVHESEVERAESLLAALGAMRGEGDEHAYRQAVDELRTLVGGDEVHLQVVNREARLQLHLPDAHRDPPGGGGHAHG